MGSNFWKKSQATNKYTKFFITFTLAIVLSITGFSSADVLDKIVVVVNDEIITQGDLDRILAPVYMQYKSIYQGEELMRKLDEARTKVMNKLIDEKLLLIEARKHDIEITEDEIDEALEDIKKPFGSREAFEKALKQENLTLTDLKEQQRDQLMVRTFIRKQIVSMITVTPIEVSNYYMTHKDEFHEPEKARLGNILIRIKADRSPEQAAALANEIHNRLKEGCDFAGLAREYSDGPGAEEGGDMGYVKKGDLMAEIDSVVFNMKPGETSGIIQTILGYHIFRVEDRVEARTRELQEVSSEIEDRLFSERIRQKIVRLVKKLREDAYISIR